MDDDQLLSHVLERVSGIDGVVAVALGGSRAAGVERPDSDWDFGLYYRGHIDTAAIRRIGWEGQVFEPGEWGGGIMNGGAWLDIDGRRVDLIYRDLDEVEHWVAEADAGRFRKELLAFFVAGIPTYVLAGELAINRVLVGTLPCPAYSDALATEAERRWHIDAMASLDFGRRAYATRGETIGAAGMLVRAVVEESHSRLAAQHEWALNEKHIADRAGLGHLATVIANLGSSADELCAAYRTVTGELATNPE